MKKHRLVPQQDEWGCGVACIASLLGISYVDAMSRVQDAAGARINFASKGLELEPIIAVLKNGGMSVFVKTDLIRWPVGTIVFLSEREGAYRGSGHYILKTEDGWMDPYHNALNRKGDEKRQAKYRKRLPADTYVQAELVTTAA